MLMENKGGDKDVISSTPEQSEQSFFGAVEKFPPNIEMPEVNMEQSSEQTADMAPSMPPAAPLQTEQQTVVKNTIPDIERNAEHIPKPYMKLVKQESDRLKKFPKEQQDAVIEFKRDYLKKAFDRTVGKAA